MSVTGYMQDGIVVQSNDTEIRLHGAPLAFLADTSAAHEIGGFKTGVGFALRKCRICLATDETIQTKVHFFDSINNVDMRTI